MNILPSKIQPGTLLSSGVPISWIKRKGKDVLLCMPAMSLLTKRVAEPGNLPRFTGKTFPAANPHRT